MAEKNNYIKDVNDLITQNNTLITKISNLYPEKDAAKGYGKETDYSNKLGDVVQSLLRNASGKREKLSDEEKEILNKIDEILQNKKSTLLNKISGEKDEDLTSKIEKTENILKSIAKRSTNIEKDIENILKKFDISKENISEFKDKVKEPLEAIIKLGENAKQLTNDLKRAANEEKNIQEKQQKNTDKGLKGFIKSVGNFIKKVVAKITSKGKGKEEKANISLQPKAQKEPVQEQKSQAQAKQKVAEEKKSLIPENNKIPNIIKSEFKKIENNLNKETIVPMELLVAIAEIKEKSEKLRENGKVPAQGIEPKNQYSQSQVIEMNKEILSGLKKLQGDEKITNQVIKQSLTEAIKEAENYDKNPTKIKEREQVQGKQASRGIS